MLLRDFEPLEDAIQTKKLRATSLLVIFVSGRAEGSEEFVRSSP